MGGVGEIEEDIADIGNGCDLRDKACDIVVFNIVPIGLVRDDAETNSPFSRHPIRLVLALNSGAENKEDQRDEGNSEVGERLHGGGVTGARLSRGLLMAG